MAPNSGKADFDGGSIYILYRFYIEFYIDRTDVHARNGYQEHLYEILLDKVKTARDLEQLKNFRRCLKWQSKGCKVDSQ